MQRGAGVGRRDYSPRRVRIEGRFDLGDLPGCGRLDAFGCQGQGGCPERGSFDCPPSFPAAAGIQGPDYVPRRLWQIRRAGWTARPFHFSPSLSPQRESRAQTMRHRVMAANIRRVDVGIAPCAVPSAQPSLHTTRALDSRCAENDGVGLPDFHCGSNNGCQVTSSYLPLHGPESGHRNADNERALGWAG